MASTQEDFKTTQRYLMQAIAVLVCILLTLSIGACSRKNSLRWTEDVLLPDGRIVMLKRYQEFKGAYEIGSTPSESDYWLEFEHPDTREIVRWAHNRHLATVALMIEKKEPYLIVKPAFGASALEYNCPSPPYLLFRYSGRKWERVELNQIPIKRLRSNMTYLPKSKRDEIESNNNHRPVEQTQRSFISTQKPWFMDFTNVAQSFGPANCNRRSNYLLTIPSASQRQEQ